MLRYFVKRSSAEDFAHVATPPLKNAWVRGYEVTAEELRRISDVYGLDANTLRDVLDKNELPRVEIRDGEVYVFLRSLEAGQHGKVKTVPLLLITKRSVFLQLTPGVVDDRKLADSKMLAHLPSGPMGLLLGTFASVLSDYEEHMQQTAHYIKDTGNRLRSHEVTNDDFIKFATIEDNLNEYRMNLDGMLVVAQRIKDSFIGTTDKEAAEDIILYIHQLLVAIDSYKQNITNIRNAYSTIANNTLNHRMKALTIFMLLVALPNVFFGMYGMNISLPFQEHPLAYVAIVSVTALAIVAVVIFGRKRNIF